MVLRPDLLLPNHCQATVRPLPELRWSSIVSQRCLTYITLAQESLPWIFLVADTAKIPFLPPHWILSFPPENFQQSNGLLGPANYGRDLRGLSSNFENATIQQRAYNLIPVYSLIGTLDCSSWYRGKVYSQNVILERLEVPGWNSALPPLSQFSDWK